MVTPDELIAHFAGLTIYRVELFYVWFADFVVGFAARVR